MSDYTFATGPVRLRESVDAGYLLHGSPCTDLTVLLPRAHTHDPQVECDRPVVYATNDPVIAVVFALLDRDRWCGKLDIEAISRPGLPTGYRIAIEATADPLADTGVVWVVAPDGFRRLPGRQHAIAQWASDAPVRPHAGVRVGRSDLKVPLVTSLVTAPASTCSHSVWAAVSGGTTSGRAGA